MKKTLFAIGFITVAVVLQGCYLFFKPAQRTSMEITEELPSFTGNRWKLIEINGKAITEMTFATEPFIEFDQETNRVSGSGGCNNFSGEMELDQIRNGIRFSKMITTRKACIDMIIETQLMEALSVVDNYSLNETTLLLNRSTTPLARFEAAKE